MESLPKLVKRPLGGLDRRALLACMRGEGAAFAAADLAAARARLSPKGVREPADCGVLLLGGSSGITRALALQLIFAERVPVFAVHYDSEKLQIGAHHARAMREAAAGEGLEARFFNADAVRAETVAEVVGALARRFRYVHLFNGIAAGAPKRFAEHGPAEVVDIDVAYDPLRQVADFSRPENLRGVGRVRVEVATENDVARTHQAMGTSTTQWATALAAAGLLVPGESVVAFADYDFAPDDPVYAKGPLASAKRLARESLGALREAHGVRTARVCYPPMNTAALGAIPGGLAGFALSAQALLARGAYRSIAALAAESMEIWRRDAVDAAPGHCELRLDAIYQQHVVSGLAAALAGLRPETALAALPLVFGNDNL